MTPDSKAEQLIATCSIGLENLLADELLALGCSSARPGVGRVMAVADAETRYRCLLWTRLASRLLLQLDEAPITQASDLQTWLSGIDWSEHLLAEGTLLVDVSGTTPFLRHTHDTALRVKDAIVDFFRQHSGKRPSVARQRPDVRFHLRLEKGKGILSLDLGGMSLHQRGYRLDVGKAPLKETLAAGLLVRAGWPEQMQDHPVLLDPFCGSGTLLLEAALMALDIAPGLLRDWHGITGWLGHQPALWRKLLQEAETCRQAAANRSLQLQGWDYDGLVLQQARANLKRLELEHQVSLHEGDFRDMPHAATPRGLIITNPPYGERLDDLDQLLPLYQDLGRVLLQGYPGWRLALFTAHKELALGIPLKPRRSYPLHNAQLPCQLYLFDLPQAGLQAAQVQQLLARQSGQPRPGAIPAAPAEISESAQQFANRIKKNLQKLARWVKRERIEAYRLYDADLPDYALAIDRYGDQVLVQEYAPPASIDPRKAQQRLHDALQLLPWLLQVTPAQLHLKQRQRQTGKRQYEKLASEQTFFSVQEGAAKLLVNMTDYLDTGLFLDHRPIRRRLFSEARGKRFLNLFCYTGSVTVQAILGGALRSTSVDMSATYLNWLQRNLHENGILTANRHQLVQADCRTWLQQNRERYDLIFMDPPSFSNSKRMKGVLDIQRDHTALIDLAMKSLSSDGLLIFSTNLRGFRLDTGLAERWDIRDITRQTLDPDFERNPRIHQCFEIRNPVYE